MITSTDAEGTFDKVQYPFTINTQQLGIEGTHLNAIKAIYYEPTANTLLKS